MNNKTTTTTTITTIITVIVIVIIVSLNKKKMLQSELGPLENMKVVGNWLSFLGKKNGGDLDF